LEVLDAPGQLDDALAQLGLGRAGRPHTDEDVAVRVPRPLTARDGGALPDRGAALGVDAPALRGARRAVLVQGHLVAAMADLRESDASREDGQVDTVRVDRPGGQAGQRVRSDGGHAATAIRTAATRSGHANRRGRTTAAGWMRSAERRTRFSTQRPNGLWSGS